MADDTTPMTGGYGRPGGVVPGQVYDFSYANSLVSSLAANISTAESVTMLAGVANKRYQLWGYAAATGGDGANPLLCTIDNASDDVVRQQIACSKQGPMFVRLASPIEFPVGSGIQLTTRNSKVGTVHYVTLIYVLV